MADLDLKPFDIVTYKAVKGKEKSSFYRFIRSIAGKDNVDEANAPVHTGLIVPINGVNKMVEMKFKDGLIANPVNLEKERFIGVTRLDLTEKEKKRIAKDVKGDLKRGVKYSKGTMAPAYLYKKDNKKKLDDAICSEYVARKIDTNSQYKSKQLWHRVTPADMAKDRSFISPKGEAGVYIERSRLVKKAEMAAMMLRY